jgi:hypothetical protein
MSTIEEVLDIDGITLTRGQMGALKARALGTYPRMAVRTRLALLNAGLLDPYYQRRATPKGVRLVTPGHVISEKLRTYADVYAEYLAALDAKHASEDALNLLLAGYHDLLSPELQRALSEYDNACERHQAAWSAYLEPSAAAGEELRSILEAQWK